MGRYPVFEIAIVILTAAAYFYYNWQYFSFVRAQKQIPRLRVRFVLLCFALNYLIFMACSVLELHLVANWSIFAAALCLETVLYTGGDRRCSLFSTLSGIICGLAIDIFCRAVISIATDLPLQNFDNHISNLGNYKWIPVLLGFLLAGGALRILVRPAYVDRLRLILRYPQHQAFLLELTAGLFFYLCLNLILYSAPFNDLVLKGWSIKSCLISVIGYYITVWYTWRICVLTDYQQANQAMEDELESWQEIVPRLRQDAVKDGLTGLYNHQYALDTLNSLYAEKIPFTLCFADLDSLKKVNDEYGHEEGDRYLCAVSEQLCHAFRRDQDLLFRYGGDEFLCVARNLPVDEAERRLEAVNQCLAEQEGNKGSRFPFSISYGVAESGKFTRAAELVAAADKKMYENKRRKQNARGR